MAHDGCKPRLKATSPSCNTWPVIRRLVKAQFLAGIQQAAKNQNSKPLKRRGVGIVQLQWLGVRDGIRNYFITAA
jgi:hypothetical protein